MGLARIAAVVVFSWFITSAIVGVFLGGQSVADVTGSLVYALGAIAVRAAVTWLSDVMASLAATRTKMQLRSHIVRAVPRLGPGWLAGRSSAAVATTATHGLDALDQYFSAYLPQLVLTAIATPIFVLIAWEQDWISALAIVITMPVIPLFMVLLGFFTQEVQQRQWNALSVLSGHFLDVVQGLSTLKIFRRERHQIGVIHNVTEEYRVRTMKVLRVSFLSGFVLELGATLAVAIVAVLIGTRLIAGTLDLQTGLFVLLITPEAFLPLRQVGANYHAAAEGVTASTDVFEILDAARAVVDRAEDIDPKEPGRGPGLHIENLVVHYPGTERATIDHCTLSIRPGVITAVVGPSGSGKSTLFAALLGFVPVSGRIQWGDQVWDRSRAAWAGQHPGLREGTIAQNIALGSTRIDEDALQEAMRLAAVDLPAAQNLGPEGAGVSGGQAQRIALARAYYRAVSRDLPVILLDEPTSALDEETEQRVVAGWRHLCAHGRTVIAITHRPGVYDQADALVHWEEVPGD